MSSQEDPFGALSRSLLERPELEDTDIGETTDVLLRPPHEVPSPNLARASYIPPYPVKLSWECGSESGSIEIVIHYGLKSLTFIWAVDCPTKRTFWLAIIPRSHTLRPSWFRLGVPSPQGEKQHYDLTNGRLGFDTMAQAFSIDAIAE